MSKIQKYECKGGVIQMPSHHKIIKFGVDFNDEFCIWAEVDEQTEIRPFPYRILGDGDLVPRHPFWHYDSVILDNGYVWHLYI